MTGGLRRFWPLGAAIAVSTLAACDQYNQECVPPISEPNRIAGYLGGSLALDAQTTWGRDSTAGALIANSYYALLETSGGRAFAFELSSYPTGRGLCSARELLPQGPLTRAVLRDVLPEDDPLVLATLTFSDVIRILDVGVKRMRSASGPDGNLLQLSTNVTYTVACAADPAAPAATPPDPRTYPRVEEVVIGSDRLQASRTDVPPIQVVMRESLAKGENAAFFPLKARYESNQGYSPLNRTSFEAVERYLGARHGKPETRYDTALSPTLRIGRLRCD